MSSEIGFVDATGGTDYVNLKNTSGQWYSTAAAAFEAFVAGNWPRYKIAANEFGTAGDYVASMPPVAAGMYYVVARRQAGAAPAPSDPKVAAGRIEWTGTAVEYQSGDAYARIGSNPDVNVHTILGSDVNASGTVDFDNLDATVSSRLPTSSYTAPPSAAVVSDAVWDEATSGHTTAGSTGKALADASTASGAPSAGAIADAVWDEATSGHQTAGSTGKGLTDAAAGGAVTDPLESTVPGSYAQGTAGYNLGRIGSGQITTVSPVAQDGNVTLVRGDAYTNALGRALEWTDTSANWPALTEAVVTMELNDGELVVGGTVVVATGAGKKVRAEPLGADTAALESGSYDFAVVATFAGTGTSAGRSDRVTLLTGKCVLTDREDT